METWLKFTIGAVSLFIAIIFINLLLSSNVVESVFSNNQPPAVQNNSPIKIFKSDMEKDLDGNLFIVGIAQNIGNAELNYSEIDAYFYDKAGNLMTKSLVKTYDLKPNETWNFKITYPGVEAYNVNSYGLYLGETW
jgi:hypothetical protein